jgi:hypothetical protein
MRGFGGVVVKACAFHLYMRLYCKFVGSILAADSCEKSQSTLCRKLTGWVWINTVKKVISELL